MRDANDDNNNSNKTFSRRRRRRKQRDKTGWAEVRTIVYVLVEDVA